MRQSACSTPLSCQESASPTTPRAHEHRRRTENSDHDPREHVALERMIFRARAACARCGPGGARAPARLATVTSFQDEGARRERRGGERQRCGYASAEHQVATLLAEPEAVDQPMDHGDPSGGAASASLRSQRAAAERVGKPQAEQSRGERHRQRRGQPERKRARRKAAGARAARFARRAPRDPRPRRRAQHRRSSRSPKRAAPRARRARRRRAARGACRRPSGPRGRWP